MAKSSSNVIDLPVKFGGVSIDSGASVGIAIQKKDLPPEKAEQVLCGRRLDVKIKTFEEGESPDQKHFEGMDSGVEVDGSCDVNSYSSKPDGYASRLHFNKKDVDFDQFAQLSKSHGRILIRGVTDIPEAEKSNGHGDLPGQKRLDSNWRSISVDELSVNGLSAGIIKSLRDGGINTLGDYSDWQNESPKPRAIENIGKKTADAIAAAVERFWGDHPELVDQDDVDDEAEDDADDE